MATTKQRQQAAKLARQQNKTANKIGANKSKLDQQMAALYNKVRFDQVSPTDEQYDMWFAWKNDYKAAGDSSRGLGTKAAWSRMAYTRTWINIVYNDEVAGFIALERVDGEIEVELSYVKPEFRGLGLSSVAYVYAQQNYNAVSVSLSNHRIAGKCAYWASLGYTSILPVADQLATAYGLASVRTDNKGIALTEDAFKAYRSRVNAEHQRMLNKTFA